MKRAKLISAIVGFVMLFLAGAIFAYVVPYGKRIDSLNNRFEHNKEMAKQACATIAKTKTPSDFAHAIASCTKCSQEFDLIQNDFNMVMTQRNALRDAWRKPSFTTNSVADIKTQIKSSLKTVPKRSIAVLGIAVKSCKDALDGATSSQEVKESLNQIETDIQAIVSSLAAVCSEKQDFLKRKNALLDATSHTLSTMADSAIKALTRYRQSATKSARAKLGTYNSVDEVVKAANSHLVVLREVEALSHRTVSFNPSPSLVRREFSSIKQDASHMTSLLGIVKEIIAAQKIANSRLESGIKKMDYANSRLQRLERYASSAVIKNVYDLWNDALSQVVSAKRALSAPSQLSSLELSVWINCNRRAVSNVQEICLQAAKHRDFVQTKYIEARKDESTVQGSVARTTKRGMDRFKRWTKKKMAALSKTRIGREIGVSAKLLILSTKAFYDLQDPNKDIKTWAMSYSGDVDKLMSEVREIERMDQPSITGKNTFIEGLVNKAYNKSFN